MTHKENYSEKIIAFDGTSSAYCTIPVHANANKIDTVQTSCKYAPPIMMSSLASASVTWQAW